MFIFLNKIFRNQTKIFKQQRRSFKDKQDLKGQVAIILIVMTAIVIIFFAITLNLGKVAELKTMTTISSHISAAQMGSAFASYAEQLFQVRLGGEAEAGADLTLCGFSEVFQIILTVLIIIIIVIICVLTFGAGCALFTVAFIVGVILLVAALLLQVLYIQPGITALWNKMMTQLGPVDRFLESGILSALQNIVDDRGQIEDVSDIDLNGKWGPGNTVARFGYYYTDRLKSIHAGVTVDIQAFVAALKLFLDFLWDPIDCLNNPSHPCCGANPPSECNPCCVDPAVVAPPACCGSTCGSAANCGALSTYGATYPFVYDKTLEDYLNAKISYLELFGRDDEHRDFHTNPFRVHNFAQVLDPERPLFRFDDTRGDIVFPVFYKFSDWGMDLGDLVYNLSDKNRRYECHLCDAADARCGDITGLLNIPGTLASASIVNGGLSPQLNLPHPPGFFNGGNCVYDPTDPNDINKKILRADVVKTLERLIVLPRNYATECGTNLTVPFDGKWKRGGDRFCSTIWPYYATCAKFGAGCPQGNTIEPCECGEPGAGSPDMFPDDPFDVFVYRMREFLVWANEIRNMDLVSLTATFREWYPSFVGWLAPKATGDPASDPFSNGLEDGWIIQMRDLLKNWINKLNDWLNASYVGRDCDQALCVPNPGTGIATVWPVREVGTPVGQCPGLKQTEAATFGTGKINDILACLDYNIANLPKFQACGSTCNESNCVDLPRSLLINNTLDPFDTNNFVVPRDADVAAFETCLLNCQLNGVYLCDHLPDIPTPWQGPSKAPIISQYTYVSEIPGVPPILPRYNALLECANPASVAPWSCAVCEAGCADQACIDACSCLGHNCTLDVKAVCACDHICSCSSNPTNPADVTCAQTCNTNYEACVTSTCTPFFQERDVLAGTCQHWNIGNKYYQAILLSWMQAKGSCLDQFKGTPLAGPDGLNFSLNWRQKLLDTALESENQIVKLQKRRDFLAARRDDVVRMRDLFQIAVFEFDKIIDAGALLMAARIKLESAAAAGSKIDEALPEHVIYGWQSEIPFNAPPGSLGKWHIIRVDARVPGRCGGNCGQQGNPIKNGKPVEPGLPTIKSYTKGFLGIKRCFSEGDAFGRYNGCDSKGEYDEPDRCFLGGTVKSQVIRWDEDKDLQLKFANGINIWKFQFHHPKHPQPVPGVNDLTIDCLPMSGAEGAFMLSREPEPADTLKYKNCWARANELLEHGIMSRSCAEYFFHPESPMGFNLKFVDCGSGDF